MAAFWCRKVGPKSQRFFVKAFDKIFCQNIWQTSLSKHLTRFFVKVPSHHPFTLFDKKLCQTFWQNILSTFWQKSLSNVLTKYFVNVWQKALSAVHENLCQTLGQHGGCDLEPKGWRFGLPCSLFLFAACRLQSIQILGFAGVGRFRHSAWCAL